MLRESLRGVADAADPMTKLAQPSPLRDARAGQPSSPKRIALLFGSFRTGGVARMRLHAAREFLDRGFAVDLVVTRKGGDLLGAVPDGAAVVELERSPLWRARAAILAADPGSLPPLLGARVIGEKPSGKLRYLPSLVGYYRRARPDAVLSATSALNLIAVWARRLARLDARIIVGDHNRLSSEALGDHTWRYGCPPALLRRGYLQADAIIAVSDGIAAELAGHTGIPRERITTVYNPVVTGDVAARAGAAIDHPWFMPGAPPVVLGVGNLKPQKDFPSLVRAFARVRQARPARLVILGDPRGPDKDASYVEELRALPAQLGVADDVSFAGFSQNPFAFMARAAVFVLSSAWEGLGNVLVEAMACGCPVVSTDCPSGPAEILDHGRYGPLVPVGDDAAMADAILKVLDAPRPAEELRARAALFSAERAVDQYLTLLFPPSSSTVP